MLVNRSNARRACFLVSVALVVGLQCFHFLSLHQQDSQQKRTLLTLTLSSVRTLQPSTADHPAGLAAPSRQAAAHHALAHSPGKTHLSQWVPQHVWDTSSHTGSNSGSSTPQHAPTKYLHTSPTVAPTRSNSSGGSSSSSSSSNSDATYVGAHTPGGTTNSSSGEGSTATGGASKPRNSLLAPVLEAQARAQHDSEYRRRLQQAASTPINIAVMTGLFWQLPTTHTQGCSVDGIPLDCHIQKGGSEEYLAKADALYYHVPSFAGKPRAKAFPNQLRLAMSLESSAYYTNLDRPSYMCQFDAEMSYRTCAQVTNWYSLESFGKLFDPPPVPFEERLHAIAYINSNCAAKSGRSEVMRRLMALGSSAKVPVHALGPCDNNTPWPPGKPSKVDVMRKYKFCVAMENSVRQDYMTEKMWDGLSAGCIPIYLGSSNAAHIIPQPDSFVRYDPSGAGDAASPEQLDALLHDIGSNKSRFEAMLAWKHSKPEEQPSEVFRYLWHSRNTTGECFLCQFLARHRAEPKPRYTTCLFNQEWMESAGQPFVPEDQACPSPP